MAYTVVPMEDDPATCKACGLNPLPPPEQCVHDPNGNGPNNPDAHIKVLHGSKGPRFQCMEENKMTSIVHNENGDSLIKPKQLVEQWDENPIAPKEPNSPEGGGVDSENESEPSVGTPKEASPLAASPTVDAVYDFDEEQDAVDILMETVKNPTYGLTEDQLDEIREWADIQDGQLSPDTLKNILGSMSGMSKQMAKLIGQKYELKLNKWIKEYQSGDDGPPIGVDSPTSFPKVSPNQVERGVQQSRQQTSTRTPTNNTTNEMDDTSESDIDDDFDKSVDRDSSDSSSESLRHERRKKRIERRNNAMDTAMEEVADEMAGEIAKNFGGEVGQGFFRVRDIALKLIEEKAKRDPDKFFELAAKFDIDIFEFLAEPSDAKKNSDGESSSAWGDEQSAADREIDNAIDSMIEDTTSSNDEPQPSATEPETQSQTTRKPEDINSNQKEGEIEDIDVEMDDEFFDDVDEEEQQEDDSFDELMK